MCGIFGYKGLSNAPEIIRNGLKRLEYRGYDSWGIAILDNTDLQIHKKIGPIGEVGQIKLDEQANLGIGHTRWATHGGVTENNAHPHLSTDNSFAVAQNGIVENYQELKKSLSKKGYKFLTETDTEIIVRLIEEKLKESKDLVDACRMAFLDLDGRNTIIVIDKKQKRLIAIRNGSPLVVGINDKEVFIASDTLSFADKTSQIIEVNNYEMIVAENKLKKFNVTDGKEIKYEVKEIDFKESKIDKEGFDHFMIKEIVEQKDTIRESTQYTAKDFESLLKDIKKAKHIYTTGAGTAYFAASQIAYALREIAGVNAVEVKSYEIESYEKIFEEGDVMIAVSQSGETADTIEALEIAQKHGVIIASIVNMVGSTIGKISKHLFLARSGPEICVAATKSFTAQIAWGYLLSNTIINRNEEFRKEILKASESLKEFFDSNLETKIDMLAKQIIKDDHFFVLGKGKNFNISLEGALKVKEISYKHFEGFAAGELKHGVIALIEKGTPLFIIVSNDTNKADMLSAAAEVKARGAYTIGIAKENNKLFDYFIKTPDLGDLDPIANVIPFQMLSYKLAIHLGLNPDKPRNLAKSVTVK